MRRTVLVFSALFSLASVPVRGAEVEDCLACHEDPELSIEKAGRSLSLYIDGGKFTSSVHGALACTACHLDADVEEFPHPEDLRPVYCGNCHEEEQLEFDSSIHGMAFKRGEPYAPTCKECHGKHDILPSSRRLSSTFKMNIPYLCGRCHREGAPLARIYNISEHNILENYSQSIHGEGLFKKGLTVTATCTDCHRSHRILPHSNRSSSVARRNIAKTCMGCHTRIEEVHIKVIKGELWEKEPGAIPACIDCHLPHKVRKEAVTLTVSDLSCLRCHRAERREGGAPRDTLTPRVERDELAASAHRNIPCVKCHSNINPLLSRPCSTAGRADCSNCHAKVAEEYLRSGHGTAREAGNAEAPYCITCHGDHNVRNHCDENALTFRSNIPTLCGKCHRGDSRIASIRGLAEVSAYTDYSRSVHGKGLVEKGLLPSAVCTDCHSSHEVLKHNDPRSTVFKRNVPATCATCHRGIYKKYIKSVHYSEDEAHMVRLPVCTDCHSSHTIADVERDNFMTEVTAQCGSCHRELAETYLETMHGKAYRLGYLKVAKCSDCHGAHSILKVTDPRASVGLLHIVKTCRKCHEDATRRFTGYLTHATHHDPVRYPILHHTYWAMTGLLMAVFGFFGLHTLLWLPRSLRAAQSRKKGHPPSSTRYYLQRFNTTERLTHLFVILSFLSLALTGMMLKFSSMPWAETLAEMLGGVVVARTIHRIAALVTFGYFFFHLGYLIRKKRKRGVCWKAFLFGKNSLLPNRQDADDFLQTMKWFFGWAERPKYGRWTYWEKFDYFAVFWGVAIIGASGLMLWFPEFFTHFLPGWFINVATIIHSDEALLAVGFIFTVHFFNTHLRPEVFPMDTVIFTGVAPFDQYREERPRELKSLRTNRRLKKRIRAHAPSRTLSRLGYLLGSVFLAVGVTLIGLIIYSVIFGYR